MASLAYNEVYSRFFGKVQAYDFLDLTELQVSEFLCNWLHSSISKTNIRKLFARTNGISLDDELQEITYEMNYKIDDASDKEFVIEVLALNIVIDWLSPKINTVTNINQLFGSSDERWFSQASHIAELRGIRDDAVKQQQYLISNRGVSYNTYLDNE